MSRTKIIGLVAFLVGSIYWSWTVVDCAAGEPPLDRSRMDAAMLVFVLLAGGGAPAVVALVMPRVIDLLGSGGEAAPSPASPNHRWIGVGLFLFAEGFIWTVRWPDHPFSTACILLIPALCLPLALRIEGGGSLRAMVAFRPTVVDGLLALGLLGFALAVGFLVRRFEPPADRVTGVLELSQAIHWPFALLVGMSAAVLEELVWRGYLFMRLCTLLGHALPAILITSVAFGAGHLYGGPVYALGVGCYGAAFSLVTLWRRNLFASTLAHVWINLLASTASGYAIVETAVWG